MSEVSINLWIKNNLHAPWLTEIMQFITKLGNTGAVWIGINLIILIYTFVKYKKISASTLLALMILLSGWLINDLVLKNIFNRDRPFLVSEEISAFLSEINFKLPSGSSFPSGHSFSSMEQALVLTFYNKKLGFLTIPLGVLIAFSRLYLGVHYLTDVLTGASLGILFAFIFFAFNEKLKNSEKLKNPKYFK